MRGRRSNGGYAEPFSTGSSSPSSPSWVLVTLVLTAGLVLSGAPAHAACSVCTGSDSIDWSDGSVNLANGSALQAGFAVRIWGSHPTTTVTVSGTATFTYLCNGVLGTLTVPLSGTYAIPAYSTSWYPSGNKSDPDSYQGSATLPNCGSNGVSLGFSGSTETFAFTVTTDHDVTVSVRWHYRGTRKSNGSLTSGNWSTALSVSVSCVACAPGIAVVEAANATSAHVGDTITYTYTVTNTGNVRLTGVSLADTRLGAVGLSDTTLDPGESAVATAQYVVQTSDLPGPVVSAATATGSPPSGSNVTGTSPAVSVSLVPTLSLQVVAGQAASLPAITGPGQYTSLGGTTLRVTSDRAGWTLSESLSYSIPTGADVGTVARIFQVAFSGYAAQAGTTDVSVSYTLSIAAQDFAGLPQGDYLITVTFTVTSGG